MKENDDFFRTVIVYGLVVQGDICDIEKLKEEVAKIDGLKVIYQKVSGNKLFIREEGEPYPPR